MFVPSVPGISMFSGQAQNFSLLLLRLYFVRATNRFFERICYLLLTEPCFPIVVAFPGCSDQFSVCLKHDDKEIRALTLELPCILMQDLAEKSIV